jgi:hypothetical protein
MPSARTIARLLTTERASKDEETVRLMVAIEAASPAIVKARNLLDRFAALISAKKPELLDPWLRDAAESEMAAFAEGITADKAAVNSAVTKTWSNGQTEGQVTRLKLIKRQMYGTHTVRAALRAARERAPSDLKSGFKVSRRCGRIFWGLSGGAAGRQTTRPGLLRRRSHRALAFRRSLGATT